MLDLKLSRRDFLKASAVSLAVASGLIRYCKGGVIEKAKGEEFKKQAEEGYKFVKTICNCCAVGCGLLAVVKDDEWLWVEPWVNNPINRGKLCCKGASANYWVNSPKRLRYPLIKRNGKWERISWDEALEIIAKKMWEVRQKYGPDAIFFAGSAKVSTEVAYLMRKFMAFWGSNNIDHQARICHSTTVAGLGNTWGYGAMTNNFNDMRNAKCIIFFSNPAEAHPVSFYHIYEAKKRGAILICCDPRFSRTAAISDLHLQLRPGTDIALILGICHEIIKNGWYDEEFIKNRTYGFEKVKEIIMQYSPEVVEEITGVPAEKIRKAAYLLAHNKPVMVQYSMGITQHEYGSQNVRALAILILLLGSVGKPGGGINAFRGHDNVQGATDMCVLSNSLPAYYGLSEKAWKHWCKVWKVDYEWIKSRFASEEMMHKEGFTISRFVVGAVADKYGFKIDQRTPIKIIFMWGHSTPAIGDLKLVKEAFESVELLVVVDPFVETAATLPDRPDGIILLPACTQYEQEGFVTNSARQIQWRNRVVSPRYESKEDLWILLKLVEKLDKYDPGLYEKFTINFGCKKPEEIRPEEIWDKEIMVGCRSIGMIGQKSWRIKRQQEYDYTFDPEDLRAKGGPCDGEYWGLPWPCWNERHPGTPILYRNDIPVWEGGHDFRVKWGTKAPDGQSLLSGINGHDQVKIGDTLWLYALDTDYSEFLDKNMVPSGRGRARFYAWDMKDPVPIHREPLYSIRLDLIDKYPMYDDKVYGEFHYRVKIKGRSWQIAWKKAKLTDVFPLIWISGRQVEHMGGGAGSRSNKILAELQPDMYVEINPKDANERGIKDGDLVAVISPRSLEYDSEPAYIVVKAKVTEAVPPGVVFTPYHWAGIFQGKSYLDRFPVMKDEWGVMDTRPIVYGDSCNIINPPGWDPETQMQVTKFGVCQVVKLEEKDAFLSKYRSRFEEFRKLLKEVM